MNIIGTQVGGTSGSNNSSLGSKFASWLSSWFKPGDNLTKALNNVVTENQVDTGSVDTLPDISSPNSAETAETYEDYNYYDDYLNMLQKGANIGLFSTAQDVADQAQLDRTFQSLEAEKERNWYEEMSNTSYQRQVQDLEAAGLNPILGWSKGFGGADTAPTAVPSGRATNLAAVAPSLTDYLNAGANLLNSASSLLQFFKPKLFSSISNVTGNYKSTSDSIIHSWANNKSTSWNTNWNHIYRGD